MIAIVAQPSSRKQYVRLAVFHLTVAAPVVWADRLAYSVRLLSRCEMTSNLNKDYADSWPVRQVRIANELWDETQEIAHGTGESAESVIRYSLAQYIQREGGKRRRPS